MKNNVEKQTQQKSTSDWNVLNEKTIITIDILQEILPLITEYFIGKFSIKDNALGMKFENGQIMHLTAIKER